VRRSALSSQDDHRAIDEMRQMVRDIGAPRQFVRSHALDGVERHAARQGQREPPT
jgi:hypothetical protein